jgi:spermidine synthase
VLVAFFGGLAAGSWWLGARADRLRQPLRLYCVLEVAAGLLAMVSAELIGPGGVLEKLSSGLLFASCASLLPITFLLGGTLPALVRSATVDPLRSSRVAGWIVGANTAGAVVGVGLAAWLIPELGLRTTLIGAALFAGGLGAIAFSLSTPRRVDSSSPVPGSVDRLPTGVLVGATLAGTATIAFEVLAARAATLRLGSSLLAWAWVLGLFLLALALGNLAFARSASSSRDPATRLGVIELGASLALTLCLWWLVPSLATSASGLTPGGIFLVAAGILPAAFLMGGAFPFLVRVGIVNPGALGASFGRLSGANTAGGIAGALLAPFLLLPWLGLERAALACAGLNLGVAVLFFARGSVGPRSRVLRVGGACLCAVLAALPVIYRPPAPGAGRVLFVEHGRQATVVVARTGGRRDLIVDGDPEASTVGNALRTERLLALLPLLVHPNPKTLLEVGLGSGITLGTAARFPLERLDCVEISPSVLRAAHLFAPDNGDIAAGRDPRVRILRGDARAFLATTDEAYDVIVANTLHPWSVGATGLYSEEYFLRMAGALRPAGIAAQWLPLQRIGADSLSAILRTFFEVFPHGGVWWGAGNLIVLGSNAALAAPDAERMRARLDAAGIDLGRWELGDEAELVSQQIADAEGVRSELADEEILTDDRPVLEVRAAGRRTGAVSSDPLQVAVRIAEASAPAGPGAGWMRLWLESLAARRAGQEERADRREALAKAGGLGFVRRERARRWVDQASRDLASGSLDAAERKLELALADDPAQRDARFGRVGIALAQGDEALALRELELLLLAHPHDAEAWNQLGTLRHRAGDASAAAQAFQEALRTDPYYPDALANAGLLALRRGDSSAALVLLERLQEISPLGMGEQERALAEAVRQLKR